MIVDRPTLAVVGEAGPEAVIPLRGGHVFVAPIGTPPPVIWQEVGGLDLSSLSFEADERLALTVERPPALTTASTSVSFTGRITPSMFRLLTGRYPLPRARVRSVTRRKYRARARRRT